MGQDVLENIKSLYRWDLLLRAIDEDEEHATVIDYMKKITIKDALMMSAKSWHDVEQKTISKSWRKLL